MTKKIVVSTDTDMDNTTVYWSMFGWVPKADKALRLTDKDAKSVLDNMNMNNATARYHDVKIVSDV